MSMFSFNADPIVVPVETTEEVVEVTEFDYSEISEDDYVSNEEPDFGDDL